MELSRGFLNIEKLTNKPHTSKVSLIPSNVIMKKISDKTEFLEESKTQKTRFNSLMAEEVPNEVYELINQTHAPIEQIYIKYCQFGEPLNSVNLKSAKFIKLLLDCGLIENEVTLLLESTNKLIHPS